MVIFQNTVFCKSILNEFAVKMNLQKPIYNTVQREGLPPIFISSLVFNGVCYNGEPGRNKKEAEQLAARVVILSHLGMFALWLLWSCFKSIYAMCVLNFVWIANLKKKKMIAMGRAIWILDVSIGSTRRY